MKQQSCLSLAWHYPSSGLILEIVRENESDFYFIEEEFVRGPFNSFFDNGEILEFHSNGIFFQFFIISKKWYVVPPHKSHIIKCEEIEEINRLLQISKGFNKKVIC